MKVLVISHMYPSAFNEVAGIFVHEQVKALVRQGCMVKVISPVPWTPFPIRELSPKWRGYSEIPFRAIWDGIEVHYPRYLTFPRMLFFASSGRWMYRGIRDLVRHIYQEFPFDLIHAHVALPDGFAAMRLKQKHHKPVVVTIHGHDLHVTLYRNEQCRQALMRVFEHVNRIITVSTKLKSIAQECVGYPEKIVVVNNGVSFEKLCSGEGERTSDSSARRIILSVSNLISTKGIDLNLKAIHKLIANNHELKYVVIGDGPEMDILIRLVSSLNLNDHVEFLGRLSHEKVMKCMAMADIFSLPSWREGFGVVYIEAMAHGKPVIACRGEGIEDVVEHGKTGLLIKPKDVDSLVEAMEYLLNYPEEAKAMGERAKELVLEHYTWKKNAGKTIRIYKELIRK